MNSRERVLTTLAHQEPDRVPIDLGCSPVTGINAMAYRRLREHLGLGDHPPVRVADIILQLAEVEEAVRQRFAVDVVGLPLLEPLPGVRNAEWQPWTLPDGTAALISADFAPEVTAKGELLVRAADSSVTHRMPAGTSQFVPGDTPLAHATLEDLDRFTPRCFSNQELEVLRSCARRLHDETDYAIFGWFGGSLIEGAQFTRGWTRFMMDLKRDREFVAALVDRLSQAALANLERYLEAVGQYVHVVGFGDDLGTQTSLQFHPELYRQLFKPYHAELYGTVHRRSQARVFLHSCGAVYNLIPDLIEVGVDILNPVQTSANGMDPERLKREFGDRLVFWGGGGCPHTVLPWATASEVTAHVRQRLRVFAPGGGYVFAPIHDILPDVPPQNIEAFYTAARRWGQYPIQ
jgi:uroporphyrinogen decarboxylase